MPVKDDDTSFLCKARDGLQALIELVGEHPKFLRPRLDDVGKLLVAVAGANSLEDSTRQISACRRARPSPADRSRVARALPP